MEMCRFAGPDDNEYRKVAAALTRATAARSRDFASHHTQELTEEQKQGLLDSLRFDQIDARHMTIKTAHAKTCRWLLQKSEYLDWCDPGKLAEHNGFLWIKGKPGAGKSTLMKFALANTRRNAKDEIVLSFFFNARGDDLEKSTSGLFRSLLVQLLEQLPSIKFRFSNLGSPTWKSNAEWTLASLQSLFEEAVLNLRDASIICFVDALDECNDQQIRDMVSFFERLGEKTVESALPFRVCFASRHYPHITMSKVHNLILEGQEGHDQDIVNYLSAKLKIGHSKLAEQIRADVQARASGVFMWVVLVTDILNREFDGGRIHRLRKRIQEIPADLHELFRSILTRDTSNREELLLCIQWVLFARKPLTPTELYFAVLSGVDPDVLLEWDKDATTSETIAKYLVDSSKGLTEITKSKSPTVQFIHESVRDFLLKEDGLREVWSDLPAGVGFQAASHDTLKECCLNCIRRGIIDAGIPVPLPKASSTEAANLRRKVGEANPILEYATHNVLGHAEAAVKGGLGQEEFLNTFPLSDWMRWQNILEKHQIRRYDLTPSLLYVLAERGLASLIELLPSASDCLAIEDQRYGVPVVAASVRGHQEALQSMLERTSATLPPTSPFHERLKDYLRSPNKGTEIKYGLGLANHFKKSLVGYLSKYGTYELLILLSLTGKLEVKLMTSITLDAWADFLECEEGERAATVLLDLQSAALLPIYWPGSLPISTTAALSAALTLQHPAAVKHLLAAHDDKSHSATSYRVLFQAPIYFGTNDMLEGLLGTLAEAEVPNVVLPMESGEHLDVAAFTKTEAVAALLRSDTYLEATKEADGMGLMTLIGHGDGQVVSVMSVRDSSLKARYNGGPTPLTIAAENGQPRVVDALTRLGVDLEATEARSIHRTALWAACHGGHYSCIELLCSRGANNEARYFNGETPLMFAVENGKLRSAASLLKWGACVHARDMNGRTPLILAVMHSRPGMPKLLLDKGADVHVKDKEGLSALAWAVIKGSAENVELLLDRGADIHAADKEGLSALSWTIKGGSLKILELLLDRGADIDAKDKTGLSALAWASKRGFREGLELLLDRGADIHGKDDKEGLTALSWAARRGCREELVFLLDRGADIHSKDKEGLTALAWATRKKRSRVAQALLGRGAHHEDVDWEAMRRPNGEDQEPLNGEDDKALDGKDREPLDQEDTEKDDIETPTVCEVCIGRRSRTVAERAAVEAAMAETATAMDETNGLDQMNELDGTGDLDEMDESDGTDADGL